MNKLKVNLLHITPEEVCLNAVGKPYRNDNPTIDLFEKIGFIFKHESCLEHCILQFSIEGVSRLLLQEQMRHRIASPTVESTRFTLTKLIDEIQNIEGSHITDLYVIPDFDSFGNSYTEEQKKDLIDMLRAECYDNIETLKRLSEMGFKNDVLKYFLHENFRTSFTWTINLRSLINYLRLRLDPSAHFEIRNLAKKIYEVMMTTWLSKLDFRKVLYKEKKVNIPEINFEFEDKDSWIITEETRKIICELLSKDLVEKEYLI